MKISKNKKAVKYIIICIITAVISIVTMLITTKVQNEIYTKQLHKQIALIIGEIQTEYPDFDDEKIIDILNNTSNYEKGKEVLKKYGITEEISASLEIEKNQKTSLYINIGIILVSFIIYIIVFIIYLRQRQKKINELDMYIQKVSRKDYSINIEESSEDELNSLKNSLYKITVMLKEEAENKKIQNEAILTSVSDISHQLKTPLTSISIMLDNILDNPQMDINTRNEFINDIKRQIININFLVSSLLKLSKLDINSVTFFNKDVYIQDIINKSIKNVAVLCDLKNIEISICENKNYKIYCDFNWQVEAITNILKNAIEHSNDNSKININYEQNKIYTKIEIRDFGMGIDKQDLPHIFERFYRGKNSSNDSVGIGLALAKAIIDKNNGDIVVDSKVNMGTTFIIKYYM